MLFLISGWRRVGKTHALGRLRLTARALGLTTGGFLSQARVEDGAKTGIDLLDAASGETVPLAMRGGDGPVRTGHYSFNPAALDSGLVYARQGQDADVFFADEIGPLELVHGQGWVSVLPIVRDRRRGVTFLVVRPELVDEARPHLGRYASAPLIMITEGNRHAVFARLDGWLRQWAAHWKP